MDEKNSFLDRNTLSAIFSSLVIFIGWQYYVSVKYPDANKKEDANIDLVEKSMAKTKSSLSQDEALESTEKTVGFSSEPTPSVAEEQIFSSNYENFNITLTSKGMGFKKVQLNNFTDREEKKITFVNPFNNLGSFVTLFKGKPVHFSVEKKSDVHFTGIGQLGSQVVIKEMIFDPENYTFNVSIKTLRGQPDQGDLVETQISNEVLKVKSSMFTPAYEGTEFFTIDEGSEEREKINIEKKYSQSFEKVSLTSIGTHYFAMALKDNSDLVPRTRVFYEPEHQVAYASVFHEARMNSGQTSIQFTGFVGPKKYDILKGLEPGFVQMIDYGMFSVLSRPILQMLKWLFGVLKNWGLAIIVLTLFIRILLLPINIASLKSMKKMQKIQPQLKAIKEKYKDDPQRVNQETMAIMKKEKANPLGGCLPMLLQIPVFLALYSALGQSVELYKAPFIFWIHDLSYQDPYFVLPVAVGVLYFIQMNITPQPMDPAQAKVMKFIPILFCFFMITVPSGLTLYFFVNTVFGIGQQFFFQREKKKAVA